MSGAFTNAAPPQPLEGTLLRIFLGESDRWDGRPLYEALVLRAREMNLAGATVLRGVLGFGRHSHLRSAHLLELSTDLPVIVEIIDSSAVIESFLPEVERMVAGGLVTLEQVQVIKYAADGGE